MKRAWIMKKVSDYQREARLTRVDALRKFKKMGKGNDKYIAFLYDNADIITDDIREFAEYLSKHPGNTLCKVEDTIDDGRNVHTFFMDNVMA